MPIDINGNVLSSTSLSSGSFVNTIVTDGLVAYFDAGNKNSYAGSGTSWVDLTGNGNTGTLVSGVGYTSDAGGGLTFDGSSQYVSIPYTNINLNTSTVVYVGKLNASPNSRNTIFSQYYGGSGAQFEIGSTGGVRSGYRQSSASTPENDPSANSNNVSTTTYFHVTVSHNTSASSITKHYINGNIIGVGTNSTQTDINGSGNIIVGNNPSVVGLYYKGNVYLVMIYNKVLHNAEVLANYYAIKSRFGI
jgi:Concanavalin A-like lectin/glucanases superfamily